MNREDKEMCNWFKFELQAYYRAAPRLKYLEGKLNHMADRFTAKSPAISGVRVQGPAHDEQLATWITEKDKVEEEIANIRIRFKMIEEVLDRIPEDEREMIKAVYSGRRTVQYYALKYYYSDRNMRRHINRVVLKALKG